MEKLLSGTRKWLERRNAFLPSVCTGLCAGVLSALVVLATTYFGWPGKNHAVGADVPLPVRFGMIDYFETKIPEEGNLGIIRVEGDVVNAFMSGETGVVIIKPLVGQPSP